MTLTQDDLRQLHEAGCPFVWYRFDTYRGSDGLFHKKDEQWELCDTIVNARFTLEAALVGYATQLLDEVWPNEHRSIHRCKDGSCYYTNIKWDNYRSLTALIVDLARMKKEQEPRCKQCNIELPMELWQAGYCGPRCRMLSTTTQAPESVTTKDMKMENGSSITFTEHGEGAFKSTGQSMTWIPKDEPITRVEFDQLRADVREIADVTDDICSTAKSFLDGIITRHDFYRILTERETRLRKVVERG